MKDADTTLEGSTTSPRHARRPAFAEAAGDCGALTDRERDVLLSLASGDTDRQIALRLRLSPRTVHKHLEHVYRKLGVATRTAAVMCIVDRYLDER